MREEYNNILTTPTEAYFIGRFGQYRYIIKAHIGLSLVNSAYFLKPSPLNITNNTIERWFGWLLEKNY